MPTLLKRLPLCLLLFALFAAKPVFAKGPPGKVTIAAPTASDEIEIRDAERLAAFTMGQFVNFEAPAEASSRLSGGYEITRCYRVGGIAGLKALDRFRYYPGHGNERGIVFYEGILDKQFIVGGSPHDGHWFSVTADGESALRGILGEQGISTTAGLPSAWRLYRGPLLLVTMLLGLLLMPAGYKVVSHSIDTGRSSTS